MFMEDKMPVIALIIGVLLAAVDQIIKYFVLTYLQPVGSVTAIDGLLDFTYVENRGVAFVLTLLLLLLFFLSHKINNLSDTIINQYRVNLSPSMRM